METVIGVAAARWAVGRALSLVTDGLLESWTASSKLSPNVRELKLELLYAQGMLNNAHGRDFRNRALDQLLLELRNVAYNADDVLDELEYFRIQDELDGTYETSDPKEWCLAGGLFLNTRHTARAVTKCLLESVCSCCRRPHDHDDDDDQHEARRGCMDALTKCLSGGCSYCGGRTHDDDDQEVCLGCMAKVISSARNTTQTVGKRIPCPSLPRNWCSKAHKRERIVPAPKLTFDRVEISQRMKDIVEQLKSLCAKVGTILELEMFGFNHTLAHDVAADKPKTTPEIIEFKLYGRENQKNNLVDNIIDGKYCANSITVVSIVGSGGIGKTTFTQHIYREVSKSNHFQVLVWICVSKNFNANRLTQEIVKKIPKIAKEEDNASDEELIQIRLQSKKFLLVLDDMWTYHEDEWNKLLAPFKKVGTTGNVVIVTTRTPKVANAIATVGCFVRLKGLEHKDCMTFFEACVFGDQQSREKHAGLRELGEEIVNKLKGIPLAVKTVGRLLRNKLTVDHWRRVLGSKEWELSSGDDDIMPALKLSYNDLPFVLQQCFYHCALFPEDYEFGKEELIHFWIGLGLLDNCDQNNIMEDIGSDYLDALIDHGFFQKSENQYAHPRYVLHDLFHELAVSISANECLSIHDSNFRSIQVPTSIRHLSISIDNPHVVKDRIAFKNFKTDLIVLGKKLRVENLRTLMLFGQHHGSFSKTFRNLFRKAMSLRVILLSGVSYDVEDLLHNFSQLIHLRYLRIIKSSYKISLPSSIPKCYHLMVLDMSFLEIEKIYWHHRTECDLGSLGREMRNLVKLRHFVAPVDGFYSSIFEVGKLKSLQKLSCFQVKREKNGFELKQLGQLGELKGSLRIEDLEKVEDVKEADEAKLVHMNHLHGLSLHWVAGQSKVAKQEEDILENLKPHSYLREISIKGHGGTCCPSWLGEDLSISNLEVLRLDGVAWKTFPPLGELCTTNEEWTRYITGPRFLNLKRVELHSLPRLKWWRGNDTFHFFSCLEVLIVRKCSGLLELPFSHCSCSQAKQRFPKLQEIDISHCPKLSSLPPIPWSIDMRIAIFKVGYIDMLQYNKDKDLCKVDMEKVDVDSKPWKKKLSFDNLSQIKSLQISKCPPMPLENMQILASLRTLVIRDCATVLCPAEGDSSAHCKIPVESLFIICCDASGKELTQLMCYFHKLRRLSLNVCKMITELGVAEKQTTAEHAPLPSTSAYKTQDAHEGQQRQQTRGEEIEAADGGLLLVPPELLRLEIWNCPYLRLCPGTLDDSTEAREKGLQGLCFLTSLSICNCPKFFASSASSTYSPFPASLQSLYIDGFTDLTGEGFWDFFPRGCLTELLVRRCPKFFTCKDTEPSRLNQHHHSRSCKLETEDIEGVLAERICGRLSPFLTNLVFSDNMRMERFTEEQEAALKMLTSLQKLRISDCRKLQSVPAGLSELPSLKRFEIRFLDSLQSIPKGGLPSSLTELRILRCTAIRSLPWVSLPSSLQNLEIIKCPEFRWLPKGTLPSSLQNLKIDNCPRIQSLPKGSLPSSLQNLKITNCPGIRSLDGLPDSLRLLYVSDSSEELRRQCHKLKGTIPIVIARARI